MRRLSLAVTFLAISSLFALPGHADTTDVAVTGTARFGASCFQLHGYSVQGRLRWEGTFSVTAPTVLPAGACFEEDPHEDVTPSCVVHSAGTFYASGKGTDNKTYAMRIVDNGTAGDLVGAEQRVVTKGAPLCGAGDVPLYAISDGGFTVVPLG